MWVRYNTTTRRVLHRSTVPFTTTPGAQEADREVPDSFAEDLEVAEVAADGSAVQVNAARQAAVDWRKVRATRNGLLAESDGLLLRAQEIGTAEQVAAWKTYRQALRDVPQQPDPKAIAWPAKPQ